MTILSTILIVLGGVVALGNLAEILQASWQRRRSRAEVTSGVSPVPFLSIIFCGLGWLLSSHHSLWVFLPAALDPATWLFLALPYFLLTSRKPDSRE